MLCMHTLGSSALDTASLSSLSFLLTVTCPMSRDYISPFQLCSLSIYRKVFHIYADINAINSWALLHFRAQHITVRVHLLLCLCPVQSVRCELASWCGWPEESSDRSLPLDECSIMASADQPNRIAPVPAPGKYAWWFCFLMSVFPVLQISVPRSR